MHIDFALPVNHDLMAGFQEWQKKAKPACADYGFHMAVTKWDEQVAMDMGKLTEQGINSFKFFMAYKVGDRIVLCWSAAACYVAHILEEGCVCLLEGAHQTRRHPTQQHVSISYHTACM